ncbi:MULTISPECIES: DUF6587 family protein [unclassified Luteimonas]|uniref:DUF6587 family protein n=1 Tax=unclassified Luteimonas TaxID=2629088 RepID=UPI0018F0C0EF|nr:MULTISPECIES: DUF6587 family protein [unclassified Luteimonas]MBJ6980937.1 hypothetical protein [Luteimonas sp. MC1572]MBJ7573795.1 hypothetical protein [Luteimonas sp. MC1828]QQO02292.1 hypothetical protein JGR64_08690 [Luteimonas sp. MC1572]
MDAGLAVQYVVVALVVLLAAWMALRRQFPGTTRRLRIAIALPLVRDGRPAWMRRLGLRIAPAGSGGGAACGNTSCGGCG